MTLQIPLTSTTIKKVLFVHIVFILQSYQHHSGHAHDHEKTAGFLNRQYLVLYCFDMVYIFLTVISPIVLTLYAG